jgi:hypothetical protein
MHRHRAACEAGKAVEFTGAVETTLASTLEPDTPTA